MYVIYAFDVYNILPNKVYGQITIREQKNL